MSAWHRLVAYDYGRNIVFKVEVFLSLLLVTI